MQGLGEGFELRTGEELHLIEEQHHTTAALLGRFAESDQDVGQIGREVLVVGKPFGCVDIEAELDLRSPTN